MPTTRRAPAESLACSLYRLDPVRDTATTYMDEPAGWESNFGMTLEAFEAYETSCVAQTQNRRSKRKRSAQVHVSWNVIQDLATHSLLFFLLTSEGKWYLSATPPPGFADWEALSFLPATSSTSTPLTNEDLAHFAQKTPALDVVYDSQRRAVGVQHKFLVPSPNWDRLKRLCPTSL